VKKLHDMQTAVLLQLFALGAVLGPAMREGLASQQLTPARAEVIWRLHDHGPMNQRQLSEILQCTPRNVTGLVDALEDAHLVERQPHPGDRRAILVTLTDEGRSIADDWRQQSGQLAAELLDGVPVSELIQLQDSLDMILERLGAPTITE
jgi:DNA-binding MarR family transcriptional regulator